MWNKEKMERTMEKKYQDCDPVHQIIYYYF